MRIVEQGLPSLKEETRAVPKEDETRDSLKEETHLWV